MALAARKLTQDMTGVVLKAKYKGFFIGQDSRTMIFRVYYDKACEKLANEKNSMSENSCRDVIDHMLQGSNKTPPNWYSRLFSSLQRAS